MMEKNTKYIFWALGLLLAWAFFKDSEATIESFSMFGNSAASTTLIGIPLILLLLIPIYGIYISVKKGYNPFKMWGSWVGMIIGLGFTFIPIIPLSTEFYHSNRIWSFIPVGFLLGWGIHALIRRYL